MTKIKICGLRRLQDIEIVNKYLPDYIGFIFAENKRRTVSIDLALELKNKLDKRIKAVGVFLNQDINYILNICNLGIIDMIQLHGNEDELYIEELKKITNKPIINAYRDDNNADYLLLDNIDPGSGVPFDWNTIERYNKPVFLAGGININNIDLALKLNPYCIDISSGVETDGYKDELKIKEIIERIRNYEKR